MENRDACHERDGFVVVWDALGIDTLDRCQAMLLATGAGSWDRWLGGSSAFAYGFLRGRIESEAEGCEARPA